jgi:hypothetical protein
VIDAERVHFVNQLKDWVRKSWKVKMLTGGLISVLITSVAFWMYWPVRHSAFGLDDPSLVHFYETTELPWLEKTILFRGANRWRPIANIGYWAMEESFGSNFTGWWVVLTLLLGLLGVSLFFITWKLTGNGFLALCLGLLLTTSHFSQYQATQATGLMEGLGNLAVLLTLGFALLHSSRQRVQDLWISVIGYAFALLLHERYLFLSVPLVCYILLARGVTRKSKQLLFVSVCLITGSYLAIKNLLFSLPLAVGTGSSTSLGFTSDSAARHAVQGIWSVFGVNLGEPYLSGLTFPNQTPFQQATTLIVFITTIVLLVRGTAGFSAARPAGKPASADLILIGLGLLSGVMVLAPAIVTIRLEQRWLVASHILLLLAIAVRFSQERMFGPNRLTKACYLTMAFALSAGLVLNYQYRQTMGGVFFRGAQIAAEQTMFNIEPVWRAAVEQDGAIYLLTNTPDPGIESSLNVLVVANTDLPERRIYSATEVGNFEFPMVNPVVAQVDPVSGEWTRWSPVEGLEVIRGGEWYEDGWAGAQANATIVTNECDVLEVTIEPSPFGKNQLVIETSWQERDELSVSDQVLKRRFNVPKVDMSQIKFSFETTWNPSELGVSNDIRSISNRLGASCVSKTR